MIKPMNGMLLVSLVKKKYSGLIHMSEQMEEKTNVVILEAVSPSKKEWIEQQGIKIKDYLCITRIPELEMEGGAIPEGQMLIHFSQLECKLMEVENEQKV